MGWLALAGAGKTSTKTLAAERETGLSPLIDLLRCIECGEGLAVTELSPTPGYPGLGPDGRLQCAGCGENYPLVAGTPRMLDRRERVRLQSDYPLAGGAFSASALSSEPATPEETVKRRTAESFAYEWRHFGALREQWRKNFLDYMRPHTAEFFRDRLVLDVGAGSGRHSLQAAQLGARVVAVDLGRSIDVARANLPPDVLTVQADAERLPLAPQSFDFVMSIGVLHHLPDPERALRAIVPFARPGGNVHVYLYWRPERALHRAILTGVSALRRLTVRLPLRLVHLLSYPLAAVLFATMVAPYRALRTRPRGRRIAEALPLKTYADYPFGVLVNDQFDRFSAPLEARYSRDDVRAMLARCRLQDVQILGNHGWVADGVAFAAFEQPG